MYIGTAAFSLDMAHTNTPAKLLPLAARSNLLGVLFSHAKPISAKAFCMMVSFTAQNTTLMFSVSVVFCVHILPNDGWTMLRMNQKYIYGITSRDLNMKGKM